ncbi:MAG: hypothetical protein IPL27_26585 [Lewinellaceae bacterium]|nr:hypothetical protein [Lewinellaceae bacterium]
MEKFQQTEAEKVLIEVNDMLQRAETLRDKGYMDNYRDILKEAKSTLENTRKTLFCKPD